MKKPFVTVCFVLFLFLSGQAQTYQGNWLVGGTGNLHLGTKNKGTLLMLSPRFGVFAANNLAFGAILPLALYSYSGSTTSSFGLSPFVRGYFGSMPTQFFVEGRIGYQRYNFNSDTGDFNDYANTFTYGIGLGVTRYITEQVGLELLVSYDETGNNDAILNTSNLTGINVNVGFQIYLPGTK
ncbi:hypothetical protein AHMF7605_03910 [Adhaeribacter arboris]|uniref:Outer membrane protein beta-barrel domain-containing protein n=1 Tax=Adhaeribacter arboris TaxID=2072846 RepID=A0A2T2YB47_9BACT|nr:hypothetical protein [Adhaeribacter arboris]PSR52729.1 hypothetical protein AHMF7605_03910 [Adhaeribacter arboris]